MFSSIIPFIKVWRVCTFGIDPEIMISCCISMIAELVTKTGEFLNSVFQNRTGHTVCAYFVCSKIPLRSLNFLCYRIYPELMCSWRITVIRWLQMVTSGMTQTLVSMARSDFLIMRAYLSCWIKWIPYTHLIWSVLMFLINPELISSTRISMES